MRAPDPPPKPLSGRRCLTRISPRPRRDQPRGAEDRRMSMATSITVRVPLAIRRPPGRTTVVAPVRDGGKAAESLRSHGVRLGGAARTGQAQLGVRDGEVVVGLPQPVG